jgi:hypothetical protein
MLSTPHRSFPATDRHSTHFRLPRKFRSEGSLKIRSFVHDLGEKNINFPAHLGGKGVSMDN